MTIKLISSLLRHRRAVVLAALVTVTAAAWVYLLLGAGTEMGSPRALLFGLLLDAYGASVCRRIDEPSLGWRDRVVCALRENRAKGVIGWAGLPGCFWPVGGPPT